MNSRITLLYNWYLTRPCKQAMLLVTLLRWRLCWMGCGLLVDFRSRAQLCAFILLLQLVCVRFLRGRRILVLQSLNILSHDREVPESRSPSVLMNWITCDHEYSMNNHNFNTFALRHFFYSNIFWTIEINRFLFYLN